MSSSVPAIRGVWRDDADARGVYSEAAGIHRLMPRAIAVPADADDVAALVRWAAAEGQPLTVRGAGSSMAGGAVGTGVVVDLSRLDAIGEVDPRSRSVVVGAGALCADVDAAARRHGLRFPVDPSSARFCTIGGMAATNAAGAHGLVHGATRAWVTAVECVFADGSRGWVRRDAPLPPCPPLTRLDGLRSGLAEAERRAPSRRAGIRKESSGYALAEWTSSGSPVDVLVGSEGTLALFTALELRLTTLPAATGTLLAAFTSLESAAAAASRLTSAGASACELLDRTFLDIARSRNPLLIPDDAEAVLLVDVEVDSAAQLDALVRSLAAAAVAAGSSFVQTAVDPHEAARLWRLRHAASPILAALTGGAVSMQVVEDGAVAPHQLSQYIHGLRAAFERSGFGGVIFGHAGDGHVHANVLADLGVADWQGRLEGLWADGVTLVEGLGGTLAGEHGDGRLRAAALERTWTASAIAGFRAVKAACDPAGILNPGVIFPDPGAPVLGAPVKHDPAIEPLPHAARAALDAIQRDRAWNRFRLAMLEEQPGI